MKVQRRSPLTGKYNTMELDVTPAQMVEVMNRPRRLIQEIFPNLTPGEREFIKSGYTQEDWDYLSPREEAK